MEDITAEAVRVEGVRVIAVDDFIEIVFHDACLLILGHLLFSSVVYRIAETAAAVSVILTKRLQFQLAVRSCPGKHERQHILLDLVDEHPIRLDMAVAEICPVIFERMVDPYTHGSNAVLHEHRQDRFPAGSSEP